MDTFDVILQCSGRLLDECENSHSLTLPVADLPARSNHDGLSLSFDQGMSKDVSRSGSDAGSTNGPLILPQRNRRSAAGSFDHGECDGDSHALHLDRLTATFASGLSTVSHRPSDIFTEGGHAGMAEIAEDKSASASASASHMANANANANTNASSSADLSSHLLLEERAFMCDIVRERIQDQCDMHSISEAQCVESKQSFDRAWRCPPK